MAIDFAFALQISKYVFVASIAAELVKSASRSFFSYARRHWTPTGLISYGLERLEAQANLITQIETQRSSSESPIPLECSLQYLERLREGRERYVSLLKNDQEKFQSTSTLLHMPRSDQDVLKDHLKGVRGVGDLGDSMREALMTWIRRDLYGILGVEREEEILENE